MQSDGSDISLISSKCYSTIQPSDSARDPFAGTSGSATQLASYQHDPAITSDEMEDDDCYECCQCCSSCMECCGLTLGFFYCCCILAECLTQLK